MRQWTLFVLASLLIGYSQSVCASGFQNADQSVSALGTAFSASSVAAEDASTVINNPAGMISLKSKAESALGRTVLFPNIRFTNQGSTRLGLPPPSPSVPFPKSSNGGHIGCSASVPYVSFVTKISPTLAFGIAASAPFGSVTHNNNESYMRYYATKSQITTININPAIAWKVNECFSIGFGFNAMYFQAFFKNNVDFGLIGTLQGIPGSIPEEQDGRAKLKGNCWGYGANVGLLFKFNNDATRLGIHWKSTVKQYLNKATIHFRFVPEELKPAFQNGRARTTARLPDTVLVGLLQRLSPVVTWYGSFQFTNWNRVKALVVELERPPFVTQTPLKWKNTWRLATGAKYDVSKKFAWRAGFAYDKNPTPNEALRTPRLPDSDRLIYTVGFHYQLTEAMGFDFAYVHLHFKPCHVDKTDFVKHPDFAILGGLKGRYKGNIDYFGFQFTRKFGEGAKKDKAKDKDKASETKAQTAANTKHKPNNNSSR